jgi:hypothetical protein
MDFLDDLWTASADGSASAFADDVDGDVFDLLADMPNAVVAAEVSLVGHQPTPLCSCTRSWL